MRSNTANIQLVLNASAGSQLDKNFLEPMFVKRLNVAVQFHFRLFSNACLSETVQTVEVLCVVSQSTVGGELFASLPLVDSQVLLCLIYRLESPSEVEQ